MLITITQYAKLVGKSERTIRQKAKSGMFLTAIKTNYVWLIDSHEPYVDHRLKENKIKRRA